jgi:glycosyltransferase involved in cell wall biosynthesis
MPSISIILPVYNGQTFITDSVNSVLQQKYTDFEFLIIDDCSTDGSWEYLNSLNDNRISLFRNEKNKGLFYNLNYLIKKSTSPIIKIWSQDDIMYENCIEEVITFHKKYPSIGFSYSNRDYIDSKGALIEINKIDNTPEIV